MGLRAIRCIVMKTRVITHFFFSIAIIFLCLYFSACASFGPTKPNQSFEGPYPSSYYELAEKNSLFAQELGRLPELQDGISPHEASALEQIGVLYNNDPDVFDNAFKKMYEVGNPKTRKYCSPLQALFWLAEDEELCEETDLLVDFSLASWATWHAVTRFYDRGKMYIMDNGTPRPRGILGPFKSIMESGYVPYIGP